MDIRNSYYQNTKLRLTDAEIRPLLRQAKDGCVEARETILEAFYAAALKIVFKFRKSGIVDQDDMLQAAMLAIHKAINAFKLDNGNTFSSYVFMAISNNVSREIAKACNAIKVPDYYYDASLHFFRKYKKTYGESIQPHEVIPFIDSVDISVFLDRYIKVSFFKKAVMIMVYGVASTEDTCAADDATIGSKLSSNGPDILDSIVYEDELVRLSKFILYKFSRKHKKIYFEHVIAEDPPTIYYLARKYKIPRKEARGAIDNINAYIKSQYRLYKEVPVVSY